MDDALDMQNKTNAVEIALGKALGFATALHGQVNGLVKSPIALVDQMAAIERALSFLAEADEIVGDNTADALCFSAGCTARLIESWLVNVAEGGHQLDAHAMDILVWDLVNKIDAARTALNCPAPVTPAKEGRCHA